MNSMYLRCIRLFKLPIFFLAKAWEFVPLVNLSFYLRCQIYVHEVEMEKTENSLYYPFNVCSI